MYSEENTNAVQSNSIFNFLKDSICSTEAEKLNNKSNRLMNAQSTTTKKLSLNKRKRKRNNKNKVKNKSKKAKRRERKLRFPLSKDKY